MGKKGFVFCNCQGICPSFKKMDVYNVLSAIRREKIFDYVCLHPQLCVADGEEFLKVLLAGKQTDRLYIAGCDPQMQVKMFRDALDAAGFDKSSLVPLDIRNKTTEEAIDAIKGMVAPAA